MQNRGIKEIPSDQMCLKTQRGNIDRGHVYNLGSTHPIYTQPIFTDYNVYIICLYYLCM